MTDAETIDRVLNASHFMALACRDGSMPHFKDLLKVIHPDKSGHPQAQEATHKLLALHDHYLAGTQGEDDSGTFVTNNYWVSYQGDPNVVEQGRKRQQNVMRNATPHLKKYMAYAWETNNKIAFDERALPLTGLTLPQEHVNWIVSRLLEFCMLLHHRTGIAHLGLTPAHVFLVPSSHGICVSGFYHSMPIGERVTTISAACRHWYPATLFTEKKATAHADLEMVRRIGAYLLGDRSGLGTSLIKTQNRDFVEFLLGSDDDSVTCYDKYRAMLDKNFAKQFIHLNI